MRRLIPAVVAAALAACSHPDRCDLEEGGAPWLTYTSLRGESFGLWLARADGTCVRALTAPQGNDAFPSFGPGWRIAYARAADLRRVLRIHDVAAADDWVVNVGTALAPTAPAFSPDGNRIAFEGERVGTLRSDVYVVPAAGGDPVALTTTGDNSGPAWSPDGASSIYFVSTRDGAYDLYAVPVAGGASVRLTTRSGIVGKPAVSPDGLALYYARPATGGNEVVRLDLATGAVAVVSSARDAEPALSPAGDRLAVSSRRAGGADLYVLDPANGAVRARITADGAANGAPSFAPAR